MTHVISLHFSSSKFTSRSRYTGEPGETGAMFSELQKNRETLRHVLMLACLRHAHALELIKFHWWGHFKLPSNSSHALRSPFQTKGGVFYDICVTFSSFKLQIRALMCYHLYQGPLSTIHVLKTSGTPTSHSLRSGKAALQDAGSVGVCVCVC